MRGTHLPYFDQILERLETLPDSSLARSFERHVHWGYYASPEAADDSAECYVAAAEELTRRICDAAGIDDGMTILDVGCGFGGTIAYLNERLSGCDLVGLDVDPRQLDRARDLVRPRTGNKVSLIEGDACALPFEGGLFDVILAVECIFHFRSRKSFFREVKRVSKPGASLALSDFILNADRLSALGEWMTANTRPENSFYGSNATPPTSGAYARVSEREGHCLTKDDDITASTLPTYPAMRRLYLEAALPDGVESTNYLEQLALLGFVQYHLLCFKNV
jgi:ubiquinone/menaquinone biosynthesis C-methylase UbiE